jgi:hypothetical protein
MFTVELPTCRRESSMIRTSWVRYLSWTTWLVTQGKSLYLNYFVLWMRYKTKIPCTWVYARASKRSGHKSEMCNLLWTPILEKSRRQNYWAAYMVLTAVIRKKIQIFPFIFFQPELELVRRQLMQTLDPSSASRSRTMNKSLPSSRIGTPTRSCRNATPVRGQGSCTPVGCQTPVKNTR